MKTFIRILVGFVLWAHASATQAATSVAPEVSHSLLGVDDDTVERGEPLRVLVTLNAPRDASGVIKLAPATGAWSSAVAVEMVAAAGGAVVVRAEPVGKPDSPTAELDAGRVAGGLWRISSEATERLAPGDYMLRARLVIASGSGWIGEAAAEEIAVKVVPPGQSVDRVAQATANRAQDALLLGNVEQAVRLLDAALVKTPDNPVLLLVRAESALRASNPMAALICLNQMGPWSGNGQPDIEREELLTRSRKALLEAEGTSSVPAAWSWPPAEVMKPTKELESLWKNSLAAGGSTPAAAVSPASPVPAATAATPSSSPTPSMPLPSAVSAQKGAGVAGALVPSSELVDAKIIADPEGQWAVGATASSQYGTPGYSAARATGAPNIPLGMAGDNSDGWCPAAKNDGTAWLELTFATPVHASEVRVRQNNAPGAMAKVELIEDHGTSHVIWEGTDPFVAPAIREIAWFAVRMPKTDYLVTKVRLTLNLAVVSGWKQIDAVQLVGKAD